MDDPRPARDQAERSRARDAPGGRRVARYITLSGQRAELRHERDRVLLDLENQLGRAPLARQLGVAERDLGRLLSGARKRLAATLAPDSEAEAQITARRLRAPGAADPAASRGAPQPASRPAAADVLKEASRADAAAAVASRERAGGRWPEADALYEALGRSSPGSVR